MLVLTRKLQEQIRIGEDIVITVLQFRGNSIRLGIEAPANVRVLRNELPQKNAAKTMQEIEIPLAALNQLTNNRIDVANVQVVRLDRNATPAISTETRPAGRPVSLTNRAAAAKNVAGSAPLAGKLQARRNTPADTAAPMAISGQDENLDSDPCPEFDLLGEDHLTACREENSAWLANAV